MVLQSRGCVDRAWDSTKHKADLSPLTPLQPPPKPGNTGRKQGRPDESVCQHAEGIEIGFGAMGRGKNNWGGKKKTGKRKNRECADIRAGVQKWKEDIFQFKSMLNESGSSTSWPYAVPGESPINCSHFCPRFNRRTVIIETAARLHSHWSCHYTDDCRNEAGEDRSGFDVVATTLHLWFISKSETVMGRATLSVFFWVVLSVCDSVASPLSSLSLLSPFDFVRIKKKKKKAGLSYKFKCRQAYAYSEWHAVYSISISRHFKCPWLSNVW